MKVLQINAVYGSKSTGVIVKDICQQLSTSGGIPSVICINSAVNEPFVITTGQRLSDKIHALMTRILGRQGLWSRRSSLKLIRQIEKINPDIVHLHNIHSNFINLSLLIKYCIDKDKPVVVTLHDCWYFTGKCYHFEDIGCDRWLTGCGHCPKRLKDIPSLLCDSSRLTFNEKAKAFGSLRNLYVVGCSNWITRLAEKSLVFSGASFQTIHNGIDTAIFRPDVTINHSTNDFTVLVMANKWFMTENTTLRECLIQRLGPGHKIMVAGCTPAQLISHPDSDRVNHIGYINSRRELADLYNKADVFLNVTFIDTLPTVNMEALACGTPVVTYRSGGSPELVADGKTGYVVEQNDIDGVVRAIDKIKAGYISRQVCADTANSIFDKNKCYDQYLNLYNQLISH